MFCENSFRILGDHGLNYTNPAWAMDIRHIMILYNILLASPYRRVLEIGSHYGASTTAFIEALNQGCQFELHLCDIEFLDSVHRLCFDQHQHGRVFYHEMPSARFLPDAPPFDFALVDGSHIAEHVQDDFEYLSMNNTGSYLLHDVRTQLLPESKEEPWYDGPLFLRNRLLASPDWMCIEDCVDRKKELTKRGILFATRSANEYSKALSIFRYWETLTYDELIALVR